MADIFRLDGKRVLITGASSGFGAHFGQVLAAQGATVILGARRVEKLEETAAAIRAAGGKAETVKLDVGNAASVAAAFAAIGRVDVVINNAGINVEASATALTEDQWDSVMDTNLKGVWLVSKEALKQWMNEKRPGNIINIASILGMVGTGDTSRPGTIAYAASKGGVIAFTRSLAAEWAQHNINVNAIAPGPFESKMMAFALGSDEGRQMVAGTVPMRRIGRPDDMAGAALFLAGRGGSYLCGETIVVDGGIASVG